MSRGFVGAGIKSDPYVLSNKIINTTSYYGIYINYTDAYFVIRDCEFSSTYSGGYDIYVDHVSNGQFINNTIYTRQETGIYLRYVNDTSVVDSTITSLIIPTIYVGQVAMQTVSTYNLILFNNTITGTYQGINLNRCYNTQIEYNNVSSTSTKD